MQQENHLPPDPRPRCFSKEFEAWLDDLQDDRHGEPGKELPQPPH